jgi:conjugal transfer pilin signal peptidase TrbI
MNSYTIEGMSEQNFKKLLFANVILGVIGFFASFYDHLAVSEVDHHGRRIFFTTSFSFEYGEATRGDYFVFREKEKNTDKEQSKYKPRFMVDKVVRKVGCSEREKLTRNENGDFFCHGLFIGKALEKDSLGNPLPQFQFSGKIPIGSLFMIGENPDSYDSRYYGLIQTNRIIGKAMPLFKTKAE